MARDRLHRAQGWQAVALCEQDWLGLDSLPERQAFLRNALPAWVEPGGSPAASRCPAPAKGGRVAGIVGRKRLR